MCDRTQELGAGNKTNANISRVSNSDYQQKETYINFKDLFFKKSENLDLFLNFCNNLPKDLTSGEVSLEYTYSFKVIYITILFLFSIILLLRALPKGLSTKVFLVEKLSSYECGFAPFSSKSIANELHYLVVGIIFLVFDLEIVYIVPFIVKSVMSHRAKLTIFVYFFIISLTVGIELKSGAISWPIWMQVNKKPKLGQSRFLFDYIEDVLEDFFIAETSQQSAKI